MMSRAERILTDLKHGVGVPRSWFVIATTRYGVYLQRYVAGLHGTSPTAPGFAVGYEEYERGGRVYVEI